jgi:tripartite-type tricarboxylate transporter receptor subunit TctC
LSGKRRQRSARRDRRHRPLFPVATSGLAWGIIAFVPARDPACLPSRAHPTEEAMWGRLACVVAIAAVSIDSPRAQDAVAEFYKGRQVTVIVGSSAGGGYDIYARLLARHMPRHSPGSPAMVVSNMAGAGSNAAAAHVYNVAPKDGTVIGALQNSAVLESLLDALLGDTKRLRHDATKFVHVGSATIDHYVCIARSDAAVKSFKDLLTRELIIGASQPGTSTRDFPAMLNNMAGAKFRLVSGYPGTREITLAIEKNEVKGLCGFSWSSLQAQRPDWIKSGFIRVLVQEHDKGHPDINRMGVPLAVDFAKTPEARRVMELIYSSETFGRPYMMSPGVPAERVVALRKAFMATMRDPELLAEAQKIGLVIDPISGEDLQALAEKIFATPATVVEQAKQALEYRAP